MSEEYVPCCGEHHVVRADARLCGSRPSIYGSVVFRKRSELDDLITALEKLRDNWNHPVAHFHLQDHELEQGSSDPTQLEITFFTPTWFDTEEQAELLRDSIDDARRSLAP